PVLLDPSQVVSSSLQVDRSGEAFLINPKRLSLLYRGPLEAVVASPLADNPNIESTAYTAGKAVDFIYRKNIESQELSFQRDVAPIFIDRCAGCHVEGGLAPWAMSSHRMLQGWSPMIREVLLTRRMPPGQIDEDIGDWKITHQLTDAEMALLV